MARTKRPATPGDLIRTMLVILLPILVVTIALTRLPGDAPVRAVDFEPALAVARAEAPFSVLAPVNLPAGWRATRVTWVARGEDHLGQPSVRNRWQLGFLSPQDTYFAVVQGDLEPAELIAAETRDGSPDGTSQVGGQSWERWVSADGRTRSLVRQTPAVTTIVVGDAGYEALEAFAGTLSDR